jgi:hypothetical protein
MNRTLNGGLVGALLAGLLAYGAPVWAASGSQPCSPELLRGVPPRSQEARTGSAFAKAAEGLEELEREALIRAELLAGNLPDHLRQLQPVVLENEGEDGKRLQVTICVTPDYLAIGSDDDYLRVPMGLGSAMTLAYNFGFMLPTPKMVDAIYQQASAHLSPSPMKPGPEMISTGYFVRHNHTIEEQMSEAEVQDDGLLAGHKKDLVLSNRLDKKPGHVAIYGWHQPDGEPIQPLSTIHRAGYSDYSHGVRLVSQIAWVNDQPIHLLDALENPQLASALTHEGTISRLVGLRGLFAAIARQKDRSGS